LGLEALPDAGVLGIEGEQAGVGFLGGVDDQRAGGDEGFLVGQGNIDAEMNGS